MLSEQEYTELIEKKEGARVCRDLANRAYDALTNLQKRDKDGVFTDLFDTVWENTEFSQQAGPGGQIEDDEDDSNAVVLGFEQLVGQVADFAKHMQEVFEEFEQDFKAAKAERDALAQQQRGKVTTTRIVGHEKTTDGRTIPIKQVVEEPEDFDGWRSIHQRLHRGMATTPPQVEVLPFLVRKDRKSK